MVAQTRSKNKNTSSSSAKIGVNVNPVPETSNKKTMKKARSKVNVADASQKARSKDIVNHNVADASKKEKKIKKKVEDGTGPVPIHCVNDMDFAFNIFLKEYVEKCSLVCPLQMKQLMEQVHEARNCFDALSRKEKQSYKKKYMEMEDQQRKRIEKENRKRSYAYFGPLPKSFRFYSLQTFYDYL